MSLRKSHLFETKTVKQNKSDSKYTSKIQIPQYLPSNKKPLVYELCDTSKYTDLLRSINSSDLPEEEKKFLRLAASRHIVFNYAKIADYYAHSAPELQELMEQSALVIIDVDDAIANGYMRLSKNIKEMLGEEE